MEWKTTNSPIGQLNQRRVMMKGLFATSMVLVFSVLGLLVGWGQAVQAQ
jgi:hypothetical protein